MRSIWLLTLLLGVTLAPLHALGEPRTLRWSDLIPGHLASKPIRPPAVDHDGPPSLEQFSPWGELPLDDLLVHELDGSDVRLAGYIVPLSMDAEQRIDEFLLVPYFGACIHVPPPPPNQVVYVTTADGLDAARVHMAWVIQGQMRVMTHRSSLADAGYTIAAQKIRLFGR